MIWDSETIDRLRRLWDEGHSTAEIGRRLCASKNMIVGKAHRLGLEARPSPILAAKGGAVSAQHHLVTLEGSTLPPLASDAALPPLPLEMGAPPAWTVWCGKLSAVTFNTMRRAKHKAECPVASQRTSLRLWECTCGVSQPESKVATARPPAVSKPSAPIIVPGRPIVRADAPDPEIAVAPTVFKPRRSEPCCWPIGQGKSMRYCDNPAEPGRVYCTEHGNRAYVKRRSAHDEATADQAAV